MDEGKAINIDFNIDKIQLDGDILPIPKFVKAMVRLVKVVSKEKQKLVLMYPNYRCGYIPLLTLAAYFHFVKEKKSRIGIKILLVSNSKETMAKYRKLSNSFGTPFVDVVYTGHLSKRGYSRIKSQGSSRGSKSGKILLEQSNIFVANPNSVVDVLDNDFDLVIIEDSQKMMSNRYFNNLSKIVESKLPIFAVMTEPNYNVIDRFNKIFDFKVLGWDEELLLADSKIFNDIHASSKQETFFPKIEEIEMPEDGYHKMLKFLWTAFQTSRKNKNSVVTNNPIVDRIFIEFSKVIQTLSANVVPYDLLCEIQTKLENYPLNKRLILIQGFITQIPEKINEQLELQKILDLCYDTLSLTPTKQKYYEKTLNFSTVQFLSFTDEVLTEAIKKHLNRSLNIISPDSSSQYSIPRVILNGITGKISNDYKTLKSIKTEKLQILTYSHEKEFLKKLNQNKKDVRVLLDLRKNVLEELHIKNYA